MSKKNSENLVSQFKNGEILNFTPSEFAHLRRTTPKVLCQERQRGQGPRFIRVGRRVFYPCKEALKMIGICISDGEAERGPLS